MVNRDTPGENMEWSWILDKIFGANDIRVVHEVHVHRFLVVRYIYNLDTHPIPI